MQLGCYQKPGAPGSNLPSFVFSAKNALSEPGDTEVLHSNAVYSDAGKDLQAFAMQAGNEGPGSGEVNGSFTLDR